MRVCQLVLPTLLPLSTAVPQQAPSSSIRGTVYADDTGLPAQGVQITLTDHSFGTRHWAGNTTTDENGKFKFADLQDGDYTVYVAKTGYLHQTLRAAQNRVIVARLRRVATVSGRVVDSDGNPLDNASVEIMTKTYIYGEVSLLGVSPGFARTDSNGLYRVSDLPPGRYYIRASCDDHETLLYPTASGLDLAQPIDITVGATRQDVDFHLRSQRRFTLSGHLIDAETKRPATAAFLRAYSANLVTGTFADGTIHAGDFEVKGMSPGRYFLSFQWVGATNNVKRTVVFPFDMTASDQSGVNLTALPRVTVSGNIKTGGQPLPSNISVALIPKAPPIKARVSGANGAWANVNTDGTFEITAVEAGDCRLAVHSAMPPQFYVKEKDLIVDGRAPINGLEPELDFSAGTVAGRALDSEGKPIAEATVVLQSVDSAKRADNTHLLLLGTNEQGEYTISGVIPGEYLVFVWKGDYGLIGDPDLFAQASAHANRVKVNPRATAHSDATELRAPW